MKKFRLCLILLCAVMLLTACGTKPQKESGTSEETTPSVTTAQQANDPTQTEEPAAPEYQILSLPATRQFSADGKILEISETDERDGIPRNAIRILSPEGEELWKINYVANGSQHCGIVGGEKCFTFWCVKIDPERSSIICRDYWLRDNGKYELGTYIAENPSRLTYYFSITENFRIYQDEFEIYLSRLEDKVRDRETIFNDAGTLMQWDVWIPHQITISQPEHNFEKTYYIFDLHDGILSHKSK